MGPGKGESHWKGDSIPLGFRQHGPVARTSQIAYACWRDDHFGRRVGFRFFGRRGVRASGFQRRSIDFEEESVLRDYTTHLERRPVECVKGVSKSTYKVVSNRLWRLCRGARGVWVRHVLTARSLGALLPSCCVCVIAHADER